MSTPQRCLGVCVGVARKRAESLASRSADVCCKPLDPVHRSRPSRHCLNASQLLRTISFVSSSGLVCCFHNHTLLPVRGDFYMIISLSGSCKYVRMLLMALGSRMSDTIFNGPPQSTHFCMSIPKYAS